MASFIYKLTVADALISSIKVSAALTREPKQIAVTKSPGWCCRSVNQVVGRWTADRWGCRCVSASQGLDSRPRPEGARLEYLTSCSSLLSLLHPT